MPYPTGLRRALAAVIVCAVALHGTVAGAAPTGGALPPSLTLLVQVTGRADVPDDAVGVALNVTVTNPAGPGFVTVYPCGDRPLASNLNYVADQTVPNFVVAGLDESGEVCIDTLAITDVIVDIAGYIPKGSPMVPLTAPQRFVDTRSGLGAPLARVAGGTVLEVPLAGGFGVPADVSTVVFNATAVQPAANGFLTVFPCGQSIPETSTLNFTPGGIVPNLVVSAVGIGGKVCFFSNVETDVVADVAAYVAGDSAGVTTLDRPQRIVDTRIGLGGPLAPVAAANRVVVVGGQSGVPGDAAAAIVNLTATGATATGYAAAFPCGGTVPTVSNLNFSAGANVANLSIVKLAVDGTMCLTANRPVDMVVDVLGYTTGMAAFVPLVPSRLYDSREGVDPPCRTAVSFKFAPGQYVKGSFELYTVDSTTPRTLPNQPDWDFAGNGFIDPSCHVFVTGVFLQDGLVLEYSANGEFIGQYPSHNFLPFYGSAVTRGLIAFSSNGNGGSIIDVKTKATIVTLPVNAGNTQWHWVGATDDGSLMATYRVGSVNNSEVWYWGDDGSVFGPVALPPGSYVNDLSKDGSYLLVTTGISQNDVSDQLMVTNLLGEPVATLATATSGQFMTDGSVAACVDPPGNAVPRLMRWDLFSPPQPYATSGWPSLCQASDVR